MPFWPRGSSTWMNAASSESCTPGPSPTGASESVSSRKPNDLVPLRFPKRALGLPLISLSFCPISSPPRTGFSRPQFAASFQGLRHVLKQRVPLLHRPLGIRIIRTGHPATRIEVIRPLALGLPEIGRTGFLQFPKGQFFAAKRQGRISSHFGQRRLWRTALPRSIRRACSGCPRNPRHRRAADPPTPHRAPSPPRGRWHQTPLLPRPCSGCPRTLFQHQDLLHVAGPDLPNQCRIFQLELGQGFRVGHLFGPSFRCDVNQALLRFCASGIGHARILRGGFGSPLVRPRTAPPRHLPPARAASRPVLQPSTPNSPWSPSRECGFPPTLPKTGAR